MSDKYPDLPPDIPILFVNALPLATLSLNYFKALYGAGGGLNWNNMLVDVVNAWSIGGTKGDGVKVAIIDTGVCYTHPDLSSNIAGGYNLTTTAKSDYMDRQGHGSHCAGIIAACENDFGVTGIAPMAKIFPIKVLGDDGSGTGDWVAMGIKYAVDEGCEVISMSLGSQAPYDPMKFEIKNALAAGIIVVCAAGNDAIPSGGNTVDWPAHYNDDPDINGAMTVVAAVDKYSSRAYFSSEGPEVTVAAPGVDIYSTFTNNSYAILSGTSMATPCIAGFAALAKARAKKDGKTITGLEFNRLISTSAKDLGTAGRDVDYGFGLIQGGQLLQEELAADTATATTTDPNVPVISSLATFASPGSASGKFRKIRKLF